MATPFIAEIRMLSFGFAPKGWAICQGQFLPINQNQALFSLLGTTFGGNGQTTFALPNLQGRVPIHWGTGGGGAYVVGQTGGEAIHTVSVPEMASHTHTPMGDSTRADAFVPGSNFWGAGGQVYATTQNASMNPNAIGNTGGSQAHNNLQPYLAVNFSIALQGIFPSQN